MKLKLVLIFALSLCFSEAYARDYHVEIIVFQHGGSIEATDEIWNVDTSSAKAHDERLSSLAAKVDTVDFHSQLSRLAGVRSGLIESGHQILQSLSWTQPSAVYQNAPVVALSSPVSDRFNGFLKVYKTSLIFADLDMRLSDTVVKLPQPTVIEDINDADSVLASNQLAPVEVMENFYISEKRRLKFKEVHYFDHPVYGAILGVWPKE